MNILSEASAKKYARFVGLLFLAIAATQAGGEEPAMRESIMRQIARSGSEATLRAIYADPQQWSKVLAGIATGQRTWVLLANQLRDSADAGALEGLQFALGEALSLNPKNVLLLATPKFPIAGICGAPDVDDSRFDSYERAIAAIQSRLKKVRSVKEASLQMATGECERVLEAAKISIGHFYQRR